jgi:hypothetical protein
MTADSQNVLSELNSAKSFNESRRNATVLPAEPVWQEKTGKSSITAEVMKMAEEIN